MTISRLRVAPLGAGLIAAGALAVSAPSAPAAPTNNGPTAQSAARQLNGVFRIGRGSYFRMIFPGGSIRRGRFFSNPDSRSRNKTYTLISAGSGGGLRTGRYQTAPRPAFDRRGNARARKIIAPTRFAGIRFSLATSHAAGPVPRVYVSNGRLSGQVRGLSAQWNKLFFRQGSSVVGRYNARTRRYVLRWSRRISGGPFNGFTGYWVLTGRFSPR